MNMNMNMNAVKKRTPQEILDDRICSHIARGSEKAREVISTYHMGEIAKIRNYMLDVLHIDFFYDARALNMAFNMAVSELGINLESLLSEGTQVVSTSKQVSKLVM